MAKKKSELDLFTDELLENQEIFIKETLEKMNANANKEIDEFEDYPILGKVLKLFGKLFGR